LYGNVARILFVRGKSNTAMIQMGDPVAVRRAVAHLDGAELMGKRLKVIHADQIRVNVIPNPEKLADGTRSFMDYSDARGNRYLTPEAAAKNKLAPPNNVLYFWNAPFDVTQEEISQLLEEAQVPKLPEVKLFPNKQADSSKSKVKVASGMLEFGSIEDAVEALCLANNLPIFREDVRFPFAFKLSFASTQNAPLGAPEPTPAAAFGIPISGGGGFENGSGMGFGRGALRGGVRGGRVERRGGNVGGRGSGMGGRGGFRGRGRSRWN